MNLNQQPYRGPLSMTLRQKYDYGGLKRGESLSIQLPEFHKPPRHAYLANRWAENRRLTWHFTQSLDPETRVLTLTRVR